MNDDRHEDFPLVPQDDPRVADTAAPAAVPDADRNRLEALLRELLRDDAIRELLCVKDELAPQETDAK
jgi:hypothetical protein